MSECLQCLAYSNSVSQVLIGSGTPNFLNFDRNAFDNGSFHSETVNNTRFTISVAGVYRVAGQLTYGSNSASATNYSCIVYVNGSAIINPVGVRTTIFSVSTSNVAPAMSVYGLLSLVPGDYLEFVAVYDGGNGLQAISRLTWGSITGPLGDASGGSVSHGNWAVGGG